MRFAYKIEKPEPLPARITNSNGCGGFLRPPGHPEHTMSIIPVRKNSKYDFTISLSSAADVPYLSDEIKAQAKQIIDSYTPTSLMSDASGQVYDWICRMLGYYRNCYSRNGVRGDDIIIYDKATPDKEKLPIDHHLGVITVREYYPDYAPTELDFQNAFWGKKPDTFKDPFEYLRTCKNSKPRMVEKIAAETSS